MRLSATFLLTILEKCEVRNRHLFKTFHYNKLYKLYFNIKNTKYNQ